MVHARAYGFTTMDATLKAQLATQLIASHPRIGFNIADPSIVASAVDAVEALEAEFDKREAAAAAATAAAKAPKPKPDDKK
jgi:hypothetical protein